MTSELVAKLPRQQLYNEIWEISVAGVAKKYNVPYAELLKVCKDNEIPVPPSGYWTQLRFGKAVEKTPLPESSITEVTLSTAAKPKRSRSSKPNTTPTKVKTSDQTKKPEEQPAVKATSTPQERFVHRSVEGGHNKYNRDQLYQEVWTEPVIQVAAKYGVSDVMIHKICKTLNVPVPPRGYWAKIRAGEKLKKEPLPPTKGITEITGTRSFEAVKVSNQSCEVLAFLPEVERQNVLMAARQITMPDENAPLHHKIKAHRSVVKEWNKKDYKDEYAQKSPKNYSNRPPFLAGVISNDTLPRVFRILHALFRQIESLGGLIKDDLTLKIRNEVVRLEVAESQDEIKHEMTRKEAQELIIYEDAKRRNSWASEPRIRKHDYVFNGRLRISIGRSKHFRDSDKATLESRLGDILITLFEESEVVRIEREAQEAAVQKRQEEARQREERRNRYNREIERTIALENTALDYEKACRIRAYVQAIQKASNQNASDNKTAAWIEWANKKADWFDPTVARKDELFGIREHEKDEDHKIVKRNWQYW